MVDAKRLISLAVTFAIMLNAATVATVWTRGPAGADGAPAVVAVVQRFYDAINIAIASSDTQPLRAVIAQSYVDTNPFASQASDRQGLVEHVQSLHAIDPGLRLFVTGTDVAGNWARVSLEIIPGSEARLKFHRSGLWPEREELAIAAGQVRERRGDNSGLVQVRFGCGFEFPASRGDDIIRVTRIEMPPRASTRVSSPLGSLGMRVIAGSATYIDVRSESSDRSAARSELTLLQEGSTVTASSGTHRISSGSNGAILLLFTQHVESVLGGPWNDRSALDPRVHAVEMLSAQQQINCAEISMMPNATVFVPSIDGVVVVPDSSLERCWPPPHKVDGLRALRNCYAEPASLLILDAAAVLFPPT